MKVFSTEPGPMGNSVNTLENESAHLCLSPTQAFWLLTLVIICLFSQYN